MSHYTYPHLFSPLTLGGLTLRNRVALPATLTNFAENTLVTERWKNFLVERARGGCGLIVSEILAVDPLALSHRAIVAGYDERNEPGLEDTAQKVHEAGGAIVAQLWHPGRQQLWQPSHSPMGVSDQPDAYSWTVPHVMSADELRRLGEAYISVAERLSRVGFDGIELHGAHGYLLTQLLSPWSNTRTDEFGGSREKRCQLIVDIARGIRQRCREGFVVGLKMPADEGVEGGIDPEEAAGITGSLSATGHFDYFSYGQGNFSISLENHVPDMHFRPGHFMALGKRMRAASNGVPVMVLGRIGTPELAEQAVAEGCGDLVGMGRAQVADAALVNKAAQGRIADIRPCTFNNYCWGEVHAGKPLLEFHNPQLGSEGEASWQPAPASVSKDIVIIGTGPAGLEAAWVAAARGHRVSVFGSGHKVGGKLRLEAALPGHGDMQQVIDYQQRLCERHGVEIELGQRVDTKRLESLNADVIIIATGSEQRAPQIEFRAQDADSVMSVHQLANHLTSGTMPGGRRALVHDFDHTSATYAAVLSLVEHFEDVVLVTPRTHIAQMVNYCSALGIHRRLHTAGVEIRTAQTPVSLSNGAVTLRNVFSARDTTLENIDLVVYSTPRQVNDTLADVQTEAEVMLIGDCMAPRNLMIAMHEGHAAGLAI
jgi:2,4-dienoyl-CoA reductase-like NADH-dependent reductase (Old Yellow Enzyme family)/thioredoxin reductase